MGPAAPHISWHRGSTRTQPSPTTSPSALPFVLLSAPPRVVPAGQNFPNPPLLPPSSLYVRQQASRQHLARSRGGSSSPPSSARCGGGGASSRGVRDVAPSPRRQTGRRWLPQGSRPPWLDPPAAGSVAGSEMSSHAAGTSNGGSVDAAGAGAARRNTRMPKCEISRRISLAYACGLLRGSLVSSQDKAEGGELSPRI